MITPATSSPAIWACLTPECLRTKPEYFVSLLLSVILFWYPPAVTTLVLILYMCRGSVGWGIMAPPTACKYNHHNEKTRTGRKKRSAICLNRTTSAFLVNNTFSKPECPFASWAFSLLRKKNIRALGERCGLRPAQDCRSCSGFSTQTLLCLQGLGAERIKWMAYQYKIQIKRLSWAS